MVSSVWHCFLLPTSVFSIYSGAASAGDKIPRRVIPAFILPLNRILRKLYKQFCGYKNVHCALW